MLQVIFRYNIKEKKATAFKEWVLKNKEKWAKCQPPGWKYLGIYFSVFGMGKFDVHERNEIENMAAFNAMREHEDEEYIGILKEWTDFIAPGARET